MKQIFIKLSSRFLQLLAHLIHILFGTSGGKLAKFLPKNQKYILNNYCGKFTFHIDTYYQMESIVWLSGIYEVTTTKFLEKVIKAGDIFIDIGANCGALTMVAASVIGKGKIYAFEPNPRVYSRLQKNLDSNPKIEATVKAFPWGVGAQNCELFLSEDSIYPGNSCISSQDCQQKITVKVVALDDWAEAEKIERIDVIKIDVEGMEYEVLQGSRAILEKYHPLVYFESISDFLKAKNHSMQTIYQFLSSLDYQIVDPQKPERAIPFSGPYPPNSLAIHHSKRSRL
ncbi:MAG: FkbM family methyltransferase [Prochloraceae cyanobacterium]